MWNVKDEIWEKQIGRSEVGYDFARREIHKQDFQNQNSPYGWNLIEFDEDDYLVVNIATERELPKSSIGKEGAEFYANGKLYNFTRNNHNEWDVNSIEYDEQFIPASNSNSSRRNQMNNDYNTDNRNYETLETSSNNFYDNYETKPDYSSSSYNNNYGNNYNETQAFSFNNYNNNYNSGLIDDTIRAQQREIDQLQQQLAYEKTQQVQLENNQKILSNRNRERLANEQLRQKQEIAQLENQLRYQNERTQQIEIERNNRKLMELKNELARTQQINMSTLENFNIEEKTARTLDSFGSNTMMNNIPFSSGTSMYGTSSFYSPTKTFNAGYDSGSSMLNNLTRKLEEQTMQIQSLKMEQKNNAKKLRTMERTKTSLNNVKSMDFANHPKQLESNSQAKKLWELKFGNNSFGTDFAGRIMIREKYGLSEEGGWDIDYYDSNSADVYIASSKTIGDRAGKQSFAIGSDTYFITRNNGIWEINKVNSGQRFEYATKNIDSIASNIKPDKEKEFIGAYETYSSLLINLNHFPLIYLDKFEEFIKKSISSLPYFKEVFIYSNERLYKKDESNISAYARVFFKTRSTKDDIEILLTCLSLKKGLLKFVNNFRITNKLDTISFSLFLMNHQKRLKFVHAQTNFELLRAHPIPLKIPLERLVIDKEYNSILKFHENNLWRKIKPYALDWNGNVYYVCDIDTDKLDIAFH